MWPNLFFIKRVTVEVCYEHTQTHTHTNTCSRTHPKIPMPIWPWRGNMMDMGMTAVSAHVGTAPRLALFASLFFFWQLQCQLLLRVQNHERNTIYCGPPSSFWSNIKPTTRTFTPPLCNLKGIEKKARYKRNPTSTLPLYISQTHIGLSDMGLRIFGASQSPDSLFPAILFLPLASSIQIQTYLNVGRRKM